MALNILTPKHSFVRFDGAISSFALPSFGSVAIAFQFLLAATEQVPLTDVFTVGIADESNNVLPGISFPVTNVCYQGRITGIDWNTDFPLDYGLYQTADELLELLRDLYDLNCYSADFLQCCEPLSKPVTFDFINAAGIAKTLTVNFYKGLQQVTIPDDLSSAFGAVPVALDDCFKYVIIRGADKVFSNSFKRFRDKKFLTTVTYSCNEDSYGFKYPADNVFNKLLLPLFVSYAKYPETRKVYRRSDNTYKVQSASIEKQRELTTEFLPEEVHEKIAVMLAHDNIHFLSGRIDNDVTKKDDYNIDWQDRLDIAQAKCNMLETFEGRNSNCERRPACAASGSCVAIAYSMFSLPDGQVGVVYNHSITLGGDAPFVLSAVTKPAWMTISISGKTVFFHGIPPGAVTDTPVNFTVSNCASANSLDFSDLISIT